MLTMKEFLAWPEYKREYGWDFVLVIGDTIKQKYENFADNVLLALAFGGLDSEPATIIASPEVCSIMETFPETEKSDGSTVRWTPIYKESGGLMYIGNFKIGSKNPEYHTHFDLYKATHPKLEKSVYSKRGDEVSVVRLFNFIM